MSNKTGSEHDECQWSSRDLEGELLAFNGRTLRTIFDKYIAYKQANIIEAGCGLGGWCEWFKRKGAQVVGIEYCEHVVLKAKSFKPDIPVELGDVTNLNYDDGTFDVYVSLGVIEHFEHGPALAIDEAHRVLKPDGIAIFTVPVLTPFRRFVVHPIRDLYFILKKMRGDQVYFWEYRYSRKELSEYLINSGFEILEEGVDDYDESYTHRHMGLWADWFFLRDNKDIWGLNAFGRVALQGLKMLFPRTWYCAGWVVVVRATKTS